MTKKIHNSEKTLNLSVFIDYRNRIHTANTKVIANSTITSSHFTFHSLSFIATFFKQQQRKKKKGSEPFIRTWEFHPRKTLKKQSKETSEKMKNFFKKMKEFFKKSLTNYETIIENQLSQIKKSVNQNDLHSISGERGIRTPGTSQYNGFQDRRNRPLCHLSKTLIQERLFSKAMQRYDFFLNLQA